MSTNHRKTIAARTIERPDKKFRLNATYVTAAKVVEGAIAELNAS